MLAIACCASPNNRSTTSDGTVRDGPATTNRMSSPVVRARSTCVRMACSTVGAAGMTGRSPRTSRRVSVKAVAAACRARSRWSRPFSTRRPLPAPPMPAPPLSPPSPTSPLSRPSPAWLSRPLAARPFPAGTSPSGTAGCALPRCSRTDASARATESWTSRTTRSRSRPVASVRASSAACACMRALTMASPAWPAKSSSRVMSGASNRRAGSRLKTMQVPITVAAHMIGTPMTACRSLRSAASMCPPRTCAYSAKVTGPPARRISPVTPSVSGNSSPERQATPRSTSLR